MTTNDVLKALPKENPVEITSVINQLAGTNHVTLSTSSPQATTGAGEGATAITAIIVTLMDDQERSIIAPMTPEQRMIYQHIKASADQGIWIKDLLRNTGLHRTSVNKQLKALEQMSVVKQVKSVKHPTRKIYMLSSQMPSLELTGGTWFDDNELDTEFIDSLAQACLSIICRRSQPESGPLPGQENGSSGGYFMVYSNPKLPTAQDLLAIINSNNIVAQPMALTDLEQLLEVMECDRKIRRIRVTREGLPTFAYIPFYGDEDPEVRGWRSPCEVCAVMMDCSYVGSQRNGISPEQCRYYDKLFEAIANLNR